MKVKVKVAQSCLTLCNSMDYTVHEILQARIPEWVAVPFPSPGDLPYPRIKPGLLHCRWIPYHLSHQRTVSIVTQITNTYIFISQFANFMLSLNTPFIEAVVRNPAFISKTKVTNEYLM